MNMDFKIEVVKHCEEIAKCNQRGGRMLSVVDLIKAGTLSVTEAAFLMARISHGDSFIVGANPGGAGKTTVMCALLNFLPPGEPIIHTRDMEILRKGKQRSPSCFLCHEIGSGSYYAYLWGEELKIFFELKSYRHRLVSNIHADNYQEVKSQVCTQNSVSEERLKSIELFLFLTVKGSYVKTERRVSGILYRDGNRYINIEERKIQDVLRSGKNRLLKNKAFLQEAVDENICRMEEFREEVLNFMF